MKKRSCIAKMTLNRRASRLPKRRKVSRILPWKASLTPRETSLLVRQQQQDKL
jgi:hypothetical protein